MSSYSWDDLQALTTARQFPVDLDGVAPAEASGRLGPMQTQTARSAFLGLAARHPGVTHEAVTEAYERGDLVRGSTIRGTVHTSTPVQHRLLQAATAVGQATTQRRAYGLTDDQLDELWRRVEAEAGDRWSPVEDVVEIVRGAVVALDPHRGPRRFDEAGRSLAHGHGGLIRRPSRGGWDRQTTPWYRTADAVVDRGPVPADPLADLVRTHLLAHGPASRQDLAWWAGVGVTVVDPVLERLGGELVDRTGPDGRTYLDLVGAADGTEVDGVRLLPEFDAVLCAYEPRARGRFVDDEVNDALWNRRNGLVRPPVLVDGRIGGHWRLDGSARRRPLTVTVLGRTRRPRRAELVAAVTRVEAALAVEVTEVHVERG